MYGKFDNGTRKLPPIEQLWAYFIPDFVNGELYYRARDVATFSKLRLGKMWNTRYAWTKCKKVSKTGYKTVGIWDNKYKAHRVLWAMYYGEDTPDEIDHIDTNSLNNCITNLRKATHRQNSHNVGISTRNTSGRKGARRHKNGGNWYSVIYNGVKYQYLGTYPDRDSAGDAYDAAAKEIHKEFARSV